MSYEEIETARATMTANGSSVPPSVVMIHAKKASLLYRPLIGSRKAGCWIEWQCQHYNGFGEPPMGLLTTAAYRRTVHAHTSCTYDTVNSTDKRRMAETNNYSGDAKLGCF